MRRLLAIMFIVTSVPVIALSQPTPGPEFSISSQQAFRIFLDSVDDVARVYVNGGEVARLEFNEPAKSVDLNPSLRQGMNDVVVELFNRRGPAGLHWTAAIDRGAAIIEEKYYLPPGTTYENQVVYEYRFRITVR
jgi:hypothetical protein